MQNPIMYNVLQPHYTPHFDENGKRVLDEKKQAAFRVSWEVVGQAASIADAKRLVAVPVLEEVK